MPRSSSRDFRNQPAERAVDEGDPSIAVEAPDVLGLVLDDRAIALLACPQRLLGALLLGDIEDVAVEQAPPRCGVVGRRGRLARPPPIAAESVLVAILAGVALAELLAATLGLAILSLVARVDSPVPVLETEVLVVLTQDRTHVGAVEQQARTVAGGLRRPRGRPGGTPRRAGCRTAVRPADAPPAGPSWFASSVRRRPPVRRSGTSGGPRARPAPGTRRRDRRRVAEPRAAMEPSFRPTAALLRRPELESASVRPWFAAASWLFCVQAHNPPAGCYL